MKVLSTESRDALGAFLEEIALSISDGKVSLFDCVRVSIRLVAFVRTLSWVTIEWEKFPHDLKSSNLRTMSADQADEARRKSQETVPPSSSQTSELRSDSTSAGL